MISKIAIEHFKSIRSVTLHPGSITVLIGENGSGKSNILEAIAFTAAAANDKLDSEFLQSRGIRPTDKELMESQITSLDNSNSVRPIHLSVCGSDSNVMFDTTISRLKDPDSPARTIWFSNPNFKGAEPGSVLNLNQSTVQDFIDKTDIQAFLKSHPIPSGETPSLAATLLMLARMGRLSNARLHSSVEAPSLLHFLTFTPENLVLRRFDDEGAIRPLGSKGEGLLKHLQFLASDPQFAKELKNHLQLLGWFGDLELPTEADEMRGRLRIRDRWLSEDAPVFDQRSANEGFLYLLFYFTLMMSKHTPKFFAIDNIDNALNPKLCAELMRQLAVLAAKHGKQLICTTHNPAILDGLNLNDDTQRLYVVRRDSEGHTVVNRVNAPRPRPDGKSIRLSTAFMEGMLGGLPDHF